MDTLPSELRSLVNVSISLLGEVIRRELGEQGFARVEKIRRQMADLRGRPEEDSLGVLRGLFTELKLLKATDRFNLALSFTLLLELTNACENAYRTLRLRKPVKVNPVTPGKNQIEMVVYVATSHPTEARSPDNISAFHQIQTLLIRFLEKTPSGQTVVLTASEQKELRHALEIAWRTPVVRNRTPKVIDEAESIYSTLLREDVISALLNFGETRVPFYLRTWVGGDKDGHPGVDEKVLQQSLMLSRKKVIRLCRSYIQEIHQTLDLFPAPKLKKSLAKFERELRSLSILRAGDAQRLVALRKTFWLLMSEYQSAVGELHPSIRLLRGILHIFPGLVVPLEMRESSDILMLPEEKKPLAIDRMLAMVARLSKGGDPRWYARGLIISMADSIEHIRAAAKKQKKAFGDLRLPIIPLFEQEGSLRKSEKIISEMLADSILSKALNEHWGGYLEMLVGYSDSSKEMGVLPSRLLIAETLPKLEKICQKAGVTPLFFHGSGGSVDRGGGSIEDQTAWWPSSALKHYKVTIQGEMVERSVTTPEIARGQLEHIVQSANARLQTLVQTPQNVALDAFAKKVSVSYRQQIHSADFLELVEKATSYSYLNVLKIGSRPVKRTDKLTVAGLRAIPWILSWTQTRLLFPTWWGVGSAWEASSPQEREQIRRAYREEPAFSSYVKALGFTVAKIELAVWFIYLEQSVGLSEAKKAAARDLFENELKKTKILLRDLTEQENLLWSQPWLGESILLRSSMIHPLNLLQILAHQEKDDRLLRLTVTGISSGMLTTG